MKPLVLSVILLSLSVLAYGEEQLIFRDIFETCKTPFITQDFDPSWESKLGMNEETTFYAVLSSKASMFRLVQEMLGVNDFEDIRESHLQNGCFRSNNSMATAEGYRNFQIHGYSDKVHNRQFIPVVNVPNSFLLPKPSLNTFGAQVFVSLSDSKTYIIYVFCHDDGLGTFVALSPDNKALPQETMDIIKVHLKALGFKEKNFMQLDYSRGCDGQVAEEVPKPVKTVPVFFYPHYLKK